MTVLPMLREFLLLTYVRIHAGGRDRGDVPGWVLITLMTAGLVAVLWGAAGTKLGNLLNNALDSVSPSK